MKTLCPNCNETVLFDNFDYYFSLIANYFTTHSIERICSKCDLAVSIYSDYIHSINIKEFKIDQTRIGNYEVIKLDKINLIIMNHYINVYPHYITIDNFKLSNIKFIFNKLNTFKNNQVFL